MIIDGTSIRMTRGDTEVLSVSCPKKPFVQGDVVHLTVRFSAGFGPPMLHKKVTEFTDDGRALVTFEHEDTAHLDFGLYSFDVQVDYHDIGIKTIVKPDDFKLDKENTYE